MARREQGNSPAGVQRQEGMLRAVRDAVARAGGARRVSGLSLIAALCASAVAPVALVGQEIGPAIATWLAVAGSVGSNLLADVITSVAGRRPPEAGSHGSAPAIQQAVAVELEVRMAGPGPQAAALRSAVADLLHGLGAQQVLLKLLAESDGEMQVALAESVALLAGRFEEFSILLVAVRDGVWALREAARQQEAENQAQAEHRRETHLMLAQILQRLEERPPPAPAVVYNSLPPDTAAFTGRAGQIAQIIGQVTQAAVHGGVVAIHAIDGMPGVGKTALAVHVAHRLAGHFPDRQLFVSLHGHSADRQPADPTAVLASLLAGDGVDPRRLPESLDELSALWRSRMAARRALLVLDDAAAGDQITPLLPGTAGCLVLVTSRRQLGDLPYAVSDISLDVLPPDEAVTMFQRLSPRAAADDDQVAHAVALVGYLPLAISLLARVYSNHRAWSLDDLIRETRARLSALAPEDDTVAAAFALSYRTLPPPRQRFFRLLSLHPGSDLDPYCAAALTESSVQQASEHLDALHSDRLLAEPVYRRYGTHDLIRTYAQTLAAASDPPEERDGALGRALDYYQHTAQSASALVARLPQHPPTGPAPTYAPDLRTPQEARAWLRVERANLEAAFNEAVSQGWDRRTVALSAALASVLRTDGPWPRALTVHAAAAAAAGRLADQGGQAGALTESGALRRLTGDYSDAMRDQRTALLLYRELGDRRGQAIALAELGSVRLLTGDFPGAAEDQRAALELFEQLGERRGQASVLTDLGQIHKVTGDDLGAVRNLAAALEHYRGLGDLFGQAVVLTRLGSTRLSTGDYPGAVRDLQAAFELYRDLGNDQGQAGAMAELGVARRLAGDLPGAMRNLEQAVQLFRETGARGNEAWALNHYAAAFAAAGNVDRALAVYSDALRLAREVEQPDDEAFALEGVGEGLIASGAIDRGTAHLNQALEIFERLGMRPDVERLQSRVADITAAGPQPR